MSWLGKLLGEMEIALDCELGTIMNIEVETQFHDLENYR